METHFQKLDVFRDVLHHYYPSDETVQTLQSTPFVALVGPSASGRDTIIGELAKTGHYYAVVTDTTRPPRTNNGVPEQNGVEYFFRDEDDMLAELQRGRYLEASIVHKHYVYGVSVREIEKAHANDKIAITDIEVVGTDAIKHLKPDTIAIFVLPPSLDVWLGRLKKRDPQMSDEELQRRMHSARNEFEVGLTRDYYRFVVNDNLALATAQVDTLVRHAAEPDMATQTAAKHTLRQLVADLDTFLDAMPDTVKTAAAPPPTTAKAKTN